MKSYVWMFLYAAAVIAAASATLGSWSLGRTGHWGPGILGLLPATMVLGFWGIVFSQPHRSKALWNMLIGTGCVVGVLGFFACLLLPVVNSGGPHPANTCKNNLRQIGIALRAYETGYGQFPPAYVADEHGKPVHSWRVLLLPHIDRPDLYEAYDFDEPWDGPNNSKLGERFIELYRCPNNSDDACTTNYMVVTGPGTAFPNDQSTELADFQDRGRKLLVMESPQKTALWTEPVDLSVAEAKEIFTAESLVGHQCGHGPYGKPVGVNVLFGDMRTQFFERLPAAAAESLFTIKDETKLHEVRAQHESRKATVPILADAWMIGAGVFGVLMILPVFWCQPQSKAVGLERELTPWSDEFHP